MGAFFPKPPDESHVVFTGRLEPVPCAKCEAYQQRIAELEADIELMQLIIDTEPKGGG